MFKIHGIKNAILFIVLCFLLNSCEGPMGPEGPQGPQGGNGDSGSGGISINGHQFEFVSDRTDGIGGIRITGYNGAGNSIVIPQEINGIPVRAIGNGAFREKYIFSITIPNSVIIIGNEAFFGNFLTSVTIPNSVTSIGNSAFQNNLLTSVTIPNSVTSIDYRAFQNNLLTSVTIGANTTLQNYTNHNDRAFPGNFIEVYNGVAGTYTRSDSDSLTWVRM